jgi:hypothetical protein
MVFNWNSSMVKETKIDIFELAEKNSGHLKKQYQLIKDNCDKKKSKLLDDLGKKIQEEWNLSINLKDTDLADFLDTGEYINI